MGTQITFRRGSSFPTAGSGITLAEPVFETTLHTFHIGLGHGVTAEWVGAPISGASAEIAAGITYKTPTLKAVKDYVTDYVTAVNGVLTVNGFAGGVTLNAGTAIGVTSSGGNITVTNLGVQSFNGLTGAVGGVTTSVANTFAPLQSFNSGISSAGGTFTEETRFASGLSASIVKTLNLSGNGTLPPSFIDGQFRLSQFIGTSTTVQSSGSTDRTIILPDADGTVALTSQLMGAVNGSTAATTAVTSFNGNTGAVQGVSSVNGSTGAITNVARTNVSNNFTAYQIINSGEGLGAPVLYLNDQSGYTMSFTPNTSFGTPNISVESSSASQILQFSATATTNTVTLPNFTTTIAGLTGTQTFTGLKTFTGGLCASAGITFNGTVSGATATFSRLTTHTAGLCAAGITVSGNIRFSGTSAKTISSNQATLTIAGASASSVLVGSNAVVMGVQVTDSLTLNSATSVVDISTTTSGQYPTIPSIRILTDDADTIGAGSIKIIPASYATANRTQYLQDADGTLALTSQLMGAVNGSTAATTAVTSFNGNTGAVQGVSSAAAGTGIFLNAATGAITITNIGVQSFNGSTGAVQGVSSVNGSTGAVTTYAGTTGQIQFRYGSGITANQNISLASPGSGDLYDQFLFYGVTYNSGGNRFVYGNVEAKGLRIDRLYGELALDEGGAVAIQALGIYNDGLGSTYGSDLYLTTPSTTNTNTSRILIAPQGSISLEIFDTGVYTAVPLSVGATFTAQAGATFGGTITGATATFSRLTTHSGGISAAGGTFSALTRFTDGITTSSLFVSGGVTFGATAEFSRSILLQNSEFIRNSTNGRIDFMPAPSGTTHYGLYVDCTTWGYGPQIGTIRSSDNALDTTGILFSGQLTMGNNTRLNLGSNGQNGIVCANQGNDTIQIFTDVTSGTNSGAVAIIDSAGQNAANRSPTTVHANPNLYIYRAGSASANDFIRIEHDGTNANIVTGGSSAIDMEPGSGFVGFSGGISASGGITFSSTMRVAGTATFAGLINSTAGLSGTGITLSGNLSAATKSFVIPHPTQPHMTLQHGSLEGPENGVYVRGRLTGTDTIPIPHYWSGLVDSSTITVTLTEIGNRNHHWVAAVDGYTVTVASEGGGIDCFYTVWGERKDVGKLPVEY